MIPQCTNLENRTRCLIASSAVKRLVGSGLSNARIKSFAGSITIIRGLAQTESVTSQQTFLGDILPITLMELDFCFCCLADQFLDIVRAKRRVPAKKDISDDTGQVRHCLFMKIAQRDVPSRPHVYGLPMT